MMDHLSRAATFDWQDETLEDQGRPADRKAAPGADTPRIGNVEALVSLRCPVGRPRSQPPDESGRASPSPMTAPAICPDSPVASLPGRRLRPDQPIPDTGPPDTDAVRRPGDITATL